MFQRILKPLLAAIAFAAAMLAPLHAAVAQDPLLTKANSVPPNLMLIYDSSGSMTLDYIYKIGLASSNGPKGPTSLTYAAFSPDINLLYYNPMNRYLARIDWDGTPLANPLSLCAGTPCTPWKVYFRNSPATNTDTGANTEYYRPSYLPATALVELNAPALSYPNNITTVLLATAGTMFPKFKQRTDCLAATWCTSMEEAQNYANWAKWYVRRQDMAETGVGAAFQGIKPDSIRLGWSTLRDLRAGSGLTRGVSLFGVTPATGTKFLFYDWLYNGNAYNSATPTIWAVDKIGQYYSRKDDKGPWATTLNAPDTSAARVTSSAAAANANHASCRRSFAMLITDGYYNDTKPATVGNLDGTTAYSISPAVGVDWTYEAVRPYTDNNSNTLADYVFKYWGTDLRPDLLNKVLPLKSGGATINPSTWQNMSFYAVTLGLDGTLNRATTDLTTVDWPLPVDNSPTAIDDTWHATINGRGELFNVGNAFELQRGLKKMFEVIAADPKTLSGVSLSATTLRIGTRKYKPEYTAGDWKGNLTALPLDPLTGNEAGGASLWQVEKGVDKITQNPISTIPAAGSRTIATWSGSAGVDFSSANTIAANAFLTTDMTNYLRGNPAKELRNVGGTYRDREAKLGDIVNSNPTYIRDNFDIGYDQASPAIAGYRAFVQAKAARSEAVLFVGANDGMMHAFRDSDGTEVFAYVPRAVLPNIHKLADTPYTHQYFVDGPTTETDAYLGGSWKNVLLSTTGGGAKAVFALDVTTPLSMTAANVMWEVNSSTSGFSELGNVLTEVQSGILNNGQWVAIFGNGYDSAGGMARLYVVNLQTGALLKEINTGVGSGNGLGGVRVLRDATSKRIIGAYAGDLKGNMWKFDLSGATSTDWKLGISGALYAGVAAQPITAAPAILPHPTSGYVVTFGTGKFFESTDTAAGVQQTMYGIWDKEPFGATIPDLAYTVSSTSQLQVQEIATLTVGARDFYTLTSNTVAWGNGFGTGKRGWYINLGNNSSPVVAGHSGERVVYPIERLAGTFVLATTLTPISAATGTDPCEAGGSGSGWAYIIDGVTGSGPTKKTVDTNGDNVVNDTDALAIGWQDPVDGRPTPISIESTPVKDKYCIVTAQIKCTTVQILCGQVGAKACPPATTSGIKSREWRQLFMR